MFAIGGTVELGLDVDARSGGKCEAVADMDVALRWRYEWRRLSINRSRIAGFYGRVRDFADGLLELGLGERLWFGQGCVTFEG